MSQTAEVDIAIIGGGVAGAYAGWRLLTGMSHSRELQLLAARRPGKKLRVGIYEYSDRIGGRLLSRTLPGAPHLPVELGGMRFLNSHTRVCGLVERFKLDKEELKVDDPGGRNLYLLRGRHFTAADWKRLDFVPPYLLEGGEAGRSPGQLLAEVALRYQSSADELREIGFWNLLERELGREAFRMVRDAVGYHTIVNNWSAAEAIPFLLADFPADAVYYKLKRGFQTLPLTLADRFKKEGGEIHHLCRLHRVDWDSGKRRVELTFDTSGCRDYVIPQTPKEQKHNLRVSAAHVILAMPRRAIELLHQDSVLFQSAEFQHNLRTVLPQPAFKIFAAYRKPWWTELRGMTAGRSLTDLPIRQCYYWGTEETSPNGNSILMASYNDGDAVEFWAGLARHPDRYTPQPFACPPGVAITPFEERYSASGRLVDELQRQLRMLHAANALNAPTDGAQLVPPYAVVYRDWTQEPYGGGWHFWKIGVHSGKVMRFMRKPLRAPDNVPLYVCGEAWSRQQGWVEGALATADDVLESELQFEPIAAEAKG